MRKKIKRQWRTFRFTARTRLFTIYAHLKHRVHIWRLLNRRARLAFNNNKPELDSLQSRLVDELRTDGISVTTLSELFPDQEILQKLQAYVEKRSDRTRPNHKKPFLEDLIPEIPELGPEIPFFEIAVHPRTLAVVNSYLGMQSVLQHFMLRRTKPAHGALPSHSQNWHRAPQEKMNCRVYIYLNEVTKDSGPFTYIPKSTFGKKWGDLARQQAVRTPYITAETIQNMVPEEEQRTITGPAGTVIFCDSTGLHRGGYSQEKTRTMSTFGYSAPTLRENIHYSYTSKTKDELPNDTKHVLNPKWQR